MIKLSLFMLDPVRAHELYVKEILELQDKLTAAIEATKLAQKERSVTYKVMKEKVRQMGKQIASMQSDD